MFPDLEPYNDLEKKKLILKWPQEKFEPPKEY